MTDAADPRPHNAEVVAEFRANGGKVGGRYAGAPMIVITTVGAKSGLQRTTPLMYLQVGDRPVLFAAEGGAPTHPDWYLNLRANPRVVVELGTETYTATAVELAGEERDSAWAAQVAIMPLAQTFQDKTTRVFPIIALERIVDGAANG